MPSRAERVTPAEAARRQPGTFQDAVPANRLRGVIRAGWQKAAPSRQLRRDKQFVAADQFKDRSGGPRGGQGVFGNRFQGYSGWRRGARAWGQQRRQTHPRSCSDGKPLESVVSLDFARRRHRASSWRRFPAGQRRRLPGGTPCNTGCELETHGCRPAGTPRGGECVRLAGISDLLAANSKTLAALRTSPLQHEAPVFGAHPHQKPVRALAMARVGLKRPHSLSHDIPSE